MINDNCELHLCLCQIEKERERERWLSQENLMMFYFSCASISERERVSSCMHIVNLHLRFGVNTRN